SGLVRYEYHYATFDQSVGRFAAEAAECANQQGAFWPYHDILYANQTGARDQYSERRLIAFAEDIDLDGGDFRSCLDEGKSSVVVQQDAALAAEMGVNATPTVFINGEKEEGSMPFEIYKEIIERKLE
ncbi:MAG: DsbA family protein, partial [Chloroflexota bacterium]|nr:DsbA family protein [Chloroflexota bacterium]